MMKHTFNEFGSLKLNLLTLCMVLEKQCFSTGGKVIATRQNDPYIYPFLIRGFYFQIAFHLLNVNVHPSKGRT